MCPVRRLARGLFVVALALPSACGSGGGGSGGPQGGGFPPPAGDVTRVFPPFGGSTEASTIVVRGTAASVDGIAGVDVAGVAATSSDQFATWSAAVPLTVGGNPIAVTATTGIGGVVSLPAIDVRREVAILGEMYAVAHDAGASKIYVLGGNDPRLYAFDEITKAVTVIASDTQGTGTTLKSAYPLVLDSAAGLAYVGTRDGSIERVLAIDLVSGNRTEVSGPNVGSGTPITGVGDMEYDEAGGRLLVADFSAGSVYWVDVGTGVRTPVSNAGLGNGPTLQPGGAVSITLDLAQNRAFTVQGSDVVAIDLATGNRTQVSGSGVGTGPSLYAQDIAFDATGARLLVGSRDTPARVLTVDPVTGHRTEFVQALAPGGGPAITNMISLALDLASNRLLIADTAGAAIRAFDLASGQRTDVWRPSRGTGVEATEIRSIALEDDGHVLLVDGRHSTGILRVDLSTGDRTVLDGGGTGFFVGQFNPVALTVDAAHGRALLAGATPGGGAVVAIDLVSGTRTIFSNPAIGFGPTFQYATGIDADATTAWITTSNPTAVLAVDLTTGQRSTVSDAATGGGPAFTTLGGVVRAFGPGVLFVGGFATGGDYGTFAVDLLTGDRSALKTAQVGTGPDVGRADGLAQSGVAGVLVGVAGNGVHTIDASTQTSAILSDNANGTGVRLGARLRLARLRSDGIVIVSDDGTNAVLAVDPTNGARIVLSK